MIKMDLDPTLAFTAVLQFYPDMPGEQARPLIDELAHVMEEADPPDRMEFARGWLAAKMGGA